MKKNCPNCNSYIDSNIEICDCGYSFNIEKHKLARIIVILFYIIGVLSLLSGIYISIKIWPKDPGPEYILKFRAYTPALTFLFAGILSSLYSFAIALVLKYLTLLRNNLKIISNNQLAQIKQKSNS